MTYVVCGRISDERTHLAVEGGESLEALREMGLAA